MNRERTNHGFPEHGGTSQDSTVAVHIAPDLRGLAWPVADLQLAPDNARKHTDADLAVLAESLLVHQQQKPIVAKRQYRGLINVVLAGNGALAAAKRLGWSQIAVVWFEGSDDDARLFALRDNRTGELSCWDETQLMALQDAGVDLLSLWHDDAALADLLRDAAPIPRFEPIDTMVRLDKLDQHCPTCRCREGDQS